ncbi:hypothetical protein ABIA24_005940 [Sinorhizobium fredii]|nr:hypothetical protein SF83666_b65890 [Sinorhizobium fredii CCBAU 83666]
MPDRAERPGKRDALALPGRQARAPIADDGLVAFGQLFDEAMRSASLAARSTSASVALWP